jgi:hypothetical protein
MKYYHVTTSYFGEDAIFKPHVPYHLHRGEDKKTPRVCVTSNWRHSLRSIIVLKRTKTFYLYSCEEEPISPDVERSRLIKEKKIKVNYNDFRLPPDGIVNKELWYTKEITMKCEGMIILPNDVYARILMSFGMPSGDPDVDELKLEPYREINPFEELKSCSYNGCFV